MKEEGLVTPKQVADIMAFCIELFKGFKDAPIAEGLQKKLFGTISHGLTYEGSGTYMIQDVFKTRIYFLFKQGKSGNLRLQKMSILAHSGHNIVSDDQGSKHLGISSYEVVTKIEDTLTFIVPCSSDKIHFSVKK